MVRIFKNARTYLVDQGTISDDLAPSYFLECLLYNVPDDNFGGSLQDTFVAAFNWLWKAVKVDSLLCQNRQLKLFGDTPELWDVAKAKQFLEALREPIPTGEGQPLAEFDHDLDFAQLRTNYTSAHK
jgi:hypothetical protein